MVCPFSTLGFVQAVSVTLLNPIGVYPSVPVMSPDVIVRAEVICPPDAPSMNLALLIEYPLGASAPTSAAEHEMFPPAKAWPQICCGLVM
jgi:hypothetical protein